MGIITDFKCRCGYTAIARYGFGTNLNYKIRNLSYAPALCKNCRELVNINENEEIPQCPECKGFDVICYNNPNLRKPGKKAVVEIDFININPDTLYNEALDENEVEKLSDSEYLEYLFGENEDFEELYRIESVEVIYYLCPKCNEFTMENKGGGFFD